MHLTLDAPLLELRAGEHFSLDDARGVRIAPVDGTLWITEEGALPDHIVAAGEAFLVTRGGRTVVQAMGAARVALTAGGLRAANDG